MASLNQVFLIGNLTRDVEIRALQSGKSIGKFGLAVNRKFRTDKGMKESVLFIDCTAWGAQADNLAKYVHRGSTLFVQGRLELERWEAQDGEKKSRITLTVENFQFMSAPGNRQSKLKVPQEPPQEGADDDVEWSEKDIPF